MSYLAFNIIQRLRGGEADILPAVAINSLADLQIDAEISASLTKNIASVTEKGLVYSETEEPTLAANDGIETLTGNTKDFTLRLRHLLPEKTYHIRAYARNADGIAYSDPVAFTTDHVALQAPHSMYLTFSGNPQSSIDIMFPAFTENYSDAEITPEQAGRNIYIREEGEQIWTNLTATIDRFPYTDSGYARDEMYICRGKVEGLTSGTVYEFRVGQNGDIEKFQTVGDAYDAITPLKVAFTGDIQGSIVQDGIDTRIGQQNPDFLVWGGDNASADNMDFDSEFHQWEDFIWNGVLPLYRKSSNGHMIPIVPQIGNHEVSVGYSEDLDDASLHYTAFPHHRDSGGYFTVDIPGLLSIFVLNTEHTAPEITATDAQTLWLRDQLQQKSDFTYKVVSQHVPTKHITTNLFSLEISPRIQEHWRPKYEQYGVSLVFEGHEHVYNRSEPLINDQVDVDGIRYYNSVGAATIRDPKNYRTTYWSQKNHGGIWLEGDSPDPTDGDPANTEQARTFQLAKFYMDEFIVNSVDKSGTIFKDALNYNPNFELGFDGWTDHNGTPLSQVASATIVAEADAPVGGQIAELYAHDVALGAQKIAVEEGKTYFCEVWARVTVDATDNGIYLGVVGYDAARNDTDNHYFLAGNYPLDVSEGWKRFSGSFTKADLPAGTAYVVPKIMVNFQQDDGVTQVDIFRLWK